MAMGKPGNARTFNHPIPSSKLKTLRTRRIDSAMLSSLKTESTVARKAPNHAKSFGLAVWECWFGQFRAPSWLDNALGADVFAVEHRGCSLCSVFRGELGNTTPFLLHGLHGYRPSCPKRRWEPGSTKVAPMSCISKRG